MKKVNDLAGIKESDTGLSVPSLWDLPADKQALQSEEPLQVIVHTCTVCLLCIIAHMYMCVSPCSVDVCFYTCDFNFFYIYCPSMLTLYQWCWPFRACLKALQRCTCNIEYSALDVSLSFRIVRT